jgi:hypothetical protein
MSDPREQEQSIKDRKKLIYDDDPKPISATVGKPFALYLRETPAEPLSGLMKAALWAAGVVVILLLAGALWKTTQPKAKAAPSQKTGAAPAQVVGARDA